MAQNQQTLLTTGVKIIAAVLIVTSLYPIRVSAAAISDYSDVSHWKLEEASGNRVDSNTTQGYDMPPINNPGNTTGLLGNALDLVVGSSQYLKDTEANVPILDFTTDFSFTGWVYFKDVPSAFAYAVIAKFGAGASNQQYSIHYDGTQVVQMYGRGSVLCSPSIGSVASSTWYFMAAIWDVGTNCYLYMIDTTDDTLFGSATSTLGTLNNTSNDFFIGNRTDLNYDANAYYDEFTIYTGVLSPQDVWTIYNNGTPLPYTAAAGGGGEEIIIIFGFLFPLVRKRYNM